MNIKELAKQAGFDVEDKVGEIWFDEGWHTSIVERFAELVAEQTHTNNKAKWYQEGYEAGQRDEREACAKVCDELANNQTNQSLLDPSDCAKAIRARSNHE